MSTKSLNIYTFYIDNTFTMMYIVYKDVLLVYKGGENMEKAYKFRIYPNRKQQELIQKTFGCVRFVYNYYLNKRIELYENDKITLSYNECSKDLTTLKGNFKWLKEPDKDALQKSLKDLDNAYKNFFRDKSVGFPKFKSKKNRHKSYRTSCTNNNIRFENKHIKLPKLGFVKVRDKQIPQGRILNATISQEPSGHYYCSLCCTDVEMLQYPKTNKNIGIDLGIVDFAILSDKTKIENPRFYEKSEKKLAKLQRELSRKTIGSSNWNKARIKVAKLQNHISNQRNDFSHKITTNIVKKYDVICIEDLDVKNMKETDSSNRNKRVNDVSWSEFRRQLTYKSKWYGKKLSIIDRYYPSSQLCSCCGHQDGKKSEEIREWTCPHCMSKLDRDINASINILNEGLRILNI